MTCGVWICRCVCARGGAVWHVVVCFDSMFIKSGVWGMLGFGVCACVAVLLVRWCVVRWRLHVSLLCRWFRDGCSLANCEWYRNSVFLSGGSAPSSNQSALFGRCLIRFGSFRGPHQKHMFRTTRAQDDVGFEQHKHGEPTGRGERIWRDERAGGVSVAKRGFEATHVHLQGATGFSQMWGRWRCPPDRSQARSDDLRRIKHVERCVRGCDEIVDRHVLGESGSPHGTGHCLGPFPTPCAQHLLVLLWFMVRANQDGTVFSTILALQVLMFLLALLTFLSTASNMFGDIRVLHMDLGYPGGCLMDLYSSRSVNMCGTIVHKITS